MFLPSIIHVAQRWIYAFYAAVDVKVPASCAAFVAELFSLGFFDEESTSLCASFTVGIPHLCCFGGTTAFVVVYRSIPASACLEGGLADPV